MSDRTTRDYVTDPWVHPPTEGTPAHRLIDAEADLVAASDAEVHQAPDGTGLVALAHAQGLIEESLR